MPARLKVAPWAAALFLFGNLAVEFLRVVPRIVALQEAETSRPLYRHAKRDCPFQNRLVALTVFAIGAATLGWFLAKREMVSRSSATALTIPAVAFLLLTALFFAWSHTRGCPLNHVEFLPHEAPYHIAPKEAS